MQIHASMHVLERQQGKENSSIIRTDEQVTILFLSVTTRRSLRYLSKVQSITIWLLYRFLVLNTSLPILQLPSIRFFQLNITSLLNNSKKVPLSMMNPIESVWIVKTDRCRRSHPPNIMPWKIFSIVRDDPHIRHLEQTTRIISRRTSNKCSSTATKSIRPIIRRAMSWTSVWNSMKRTRISSIQPIDHERWIPLVNPVRWNGNIPMAIAIRRMAHRLHPHESSMPMLFVIFVER